MSLEAYWSTRENFRSTWDYHWTKAEISNIVILIFKCFQIFFDMTVGVIFHFQDDNQNSITLYSKYELWITVYYQLLNQTILANMLFQIVFFILLL